MSLIQSQSPSARVTACADIDPDALHNLLKRVGLNLSWVTAGKAIPGSFWGEPEAGLVADTLYLRADTPVHSALHEACHYICMSPARRRGLHTNAGGDYDEENAVCYLQIVLADTLPGLNSGQLMTDMDMWGYTFRLGSARAWFEQDADDALQWLQRHGVLNEARRPTWHVRDSEAIAGPGETDGI